GSSDKTVRLWETNTGKCLAVLSGFTSGITSVASSRKARGSCIAVGSWDNLVRYFQMKTIGGVQKTEVQLLWNSDQNSLHLSGANFEGAILSSRNAKLIEQRGCVGNPREVTGTVAATSTAISAGSAGANI